MLTKNEIEQINSAVEEITSSRGADPRAHMVLVEMLVDYPWKISGKKGVIKKGTEVIAELPDNLLWKNPPPSPRELSKIKLGVRVPPEKTRGVKTKIVKMNPKNYKFLHYLRV